VCNTRAAKRQDALDLLGMARHRLAPPGGGGPAPDAAQAIEEEWMAAQRGKDGGKGGGKGADKGNLDDFVVEDDKEVGLV
jgi:hypothetical protein